MSYTIRQIAAEFEVSYRTLRFYEQRGLIFPTRDGSGSRHYSDADRNRLQHIQAWTRYGFTLTEIKAALQNGGVSNDQMIEQLEVLRHQRNEMDLAILEMDQLVKGQRTAFN